MIVSSWLSRIYSPIETRTFNTERSFVSERSAFVLLPNDESLIDEKLRVATEVGAQIGGTK